MSISYFYLATISFFIGIFVASLFTPTLPVLVWLMMLALVSAILWRWAGSDDTTAQTFLFVGIALVFFVLGASRFIMSSETFAHSAFDNQVEQKIEINGTVVREPDRRANSLHLYLEVENGEILLVTTDRYQNTLYGDMVKVEGTLKRPEAFVTDLGRTFDYPGYLLAKGVKYQLSFAEVEVLQSGEGNFIIRNLLNFKQLFLNRLETVIAEPAVGLGEGLLLGVKRALGDELESAFRKTGIIHIVVLSGYNVMLVVAFVMFVLGYFLRPRAKVLAGIIAIILFAILVGLSATVVRACFMASLLLIAHAYGRQYLVLRALMLAGVVMLIINPYLLVYDVGFQLSFLATLGLILVAPVLERYFVFLPSTFGLKMFFMATLSTQITVLPLLLYHMGEFSMVAILVNMLVLPVVPFAMLLTFATGLVAFLSSSLSGLLAFPTYFILQYINVTALWFGSLPFAALDVPSFSFYLVFPAYFILGYFVWKNYQVQSKNDYGDLAESLVRATLHKEKTLGKSEDLSDWEVIEEIELEPGQGIKSKVIEGNQDLPIFFR